MDVSDPPEKTKVSGPVIRTGIRTTAHPDADVFQSVVVQVRSIQEIENGLHGRAGEIDPKLASLRTGTGDNAPKQARLIRQSPERLDPFIHIFQK